MYIATKHVHINDKGMQIEEYEIVVGGPSPEFCEFAGVATIGLQTPRGTMPHTFKFPIEISSDCSGRTNRLTKAFDAFEDTLKAAIPGEIENIKKQMAEHNSKAQSPLIIPASAAAR